MLRHGDENHLRLSPDVPTWPLEMSEQHKMYEPSLLTSYTHARLIHECLGTHFQVHITIWLVRKLNGWMAGGLLVGWLAVVAGWGIGWARWTGWLGSVWLACRMGWLAGWNPIKSNCKWEVLTFFKNVVIMCGVGVEVRQEMWQL